MGLALLWASLISGSFADEVTLSMKEWEALQPKEIHAPDVRTAPWAAYRYISVRHEGDRMRIRGRWVVDAQRSGRFEQLLIGSNALVERLTVNGRLVPAEKRRDGNTWLSVNIQGRAVVEMTSFVDANPMKGWANLELMPSVRGELVVENDELESRLMHVVPEGIQGQNKRQLTPLEGRFWTGNRRLFLALSKPTRKQAGNRWAASARVAVGLTVEENAVLGRASIYWDVGSGKSESVRVLVDAPLEALHVEGTNIAAWRRSGRYLELELTDPAAHGMEVHLSWTHPVSVTEQTGLSIPRIEPVGVEHLESTLQLATAGELEVIPDIVGMEPVAFEDMRGWGKNMISASPAAMYQGERVPAGRLTLYKYLPADSPPVLVDVASTIMALTEEGRVLARTRLTVRNETAASLGFCLPSGHRLIGLTVQGMAVRPRKMEECWSVSLPRSVETLKGGLAFPVDLLMIGETDAWTRKESRELVWLNIAAPVAVSHITTYLPQDYKMNELPSSAGQVARFSEGEGLAYGYGLNGSEEALADRLFQESIAAWMDNRFDDARGKLSALTALGAQNENIERLQSNVSFILDEDEEDGDDSGAGRRLKDQARARALEEELQQTDILEKADQAMAEGKYEEAEAAYEVVTESMKRLAGVEQKESVAMATQYEKVKVARNKAKKSAERDKKQRSAMSRKAKTAESEPIRSLKEEYVAGTVGSVFEGSSSGYAAPPPPPPPPSPQSVSKPAKNPIDSFDFAGGKGALDNKSVSGEAEFPAGESNQRDPQTQVVVSAIATDLIIPKQGQAVRYQHVLVPTEKPVTILISAMKPRRTP